MWQTFHLVSYARMQIEGVINLRLLTLLFRDPNELRTLADQFLISLVIRKLCSIRLNRNVLTNS